MYCIIINISIAVCQFVSFLHLEKNYIKTLLFSHAGVLANLDGYMNIALEQTEEYVNGQLKNKYGDAFIRGNNGT